VSRHANIFLCYQYRFSRVILPPILTNKLFHPIYIYFNIQFDYTFHGSFGANRGHALYNVSLEQLMQETTFVSLFSKCNVRKDAFKLVFDQICKCANDMLSGEYEDLSVLTIRVDLVVTRPDDEEEEEMEVEAQDEVSELVPAISRAMKAESCEGEENMCLDEEEEEETNELVHARAIEGESYEVDYEDYSGYGNQQKEQCASPTFSPFTKLILLWEPTKRRKKNYFKK
jgi:hypothetical protein